MHDPTRPLIPLHATEARDRRRVGGKALGLARLVEQGLPVPPALVIPVEVFQEALVRNGLWESACRLAREPDADRAEALQAAIRSAPLSSHLAAALRRNAGVRRQGGKGDAGRRRLGPLLAVRSSAVEEDARGASYAGMYHTELSVRPGDHLERAVKACWASAFQLRALRYRRRAGATGEPAMAVLVQEMVRARCAGVLFTVNPMTGSWREMTVEAAWGLGEAVVGGRVVPDHYQVRRPRRLPEPMQRFAARLRLEVAEETVQPQQRRLVMGREGPVWEPVPPRLRHRRKLPHGDLLALCRLGLRCEARAGFPQDMEWALDDRGRIVFLQARPVTTTARPYRGGDTLWTRRFIGERWTEPPTPLGWSLVKPLLEHFIAYPRTQRRYLGGGQALQLVDGTPYLNATVFRHLAFKLPGTPPPRFMMDMLPPAEERDWMSRFAARPGFRIYAAILAETFLERRWRRFRWNPLTNHKAWYDFERRLLAELPALERTRPQNASEAIGHARHGMDLAREYVKIHVTSLLFANLLYQIAGGLLGLWLGADGERIAREVLRCPEENLTVSTNHDLWELARLARREGVDLSVPPDDSSLRRGAFGRAFRLFLDHHGHRSDATWEVMSTRWRQAPERVLAMVRQQLDAGERDPSRLAWEQGEVARRARNEIFRRVGCPVQRALLLYVVDLTRAYLLLRENQRYRFERLLYVVQRSYLELGRFWVERGWLEKPGEIRFMEAGEIEAAEEGRLAPEQVRATVQRRSEAWERNRHRQPSDFLVGDEPVPDARLGNRETGDRRLEGLGASPGTVRGRVRVLRHLNESSRLREGEILVARSTDPGWTPLFLVAAGVVLEMGSQLCHGAVVAREYGLPTVVNVRSATRLFRDGQEVTVDGGRGVVWIHDATEEDPDPDARSPGAS